VKLGDIVKVKVLEVSGARKPIAAQRFNDGQMTSRGPAKQDNGGGAFAEAMHRAVDNCEATTDRRKAHCRRLPLPFGWLGPL